MDGMVGQHRNEQVRTDTDVRAMPDWAQDALGLQRPPGIFKVSQSKNKCGESLHSRSQIGVADH